MKNIFVIICSIIIPVFSLNEITPKLCINCKFFTNSFINSVVFNNNYGKCSLFKKMESDIDDIDYLVTGIKKKPDFTFCSIARDYDSMCGKEGKKYISKLNNN